MCLLREWIRKRPAGSVRRGVEWVRSASLHHSTDTGRASSRAGAGKEEVEPPAIGPDHGTNVRSRPRVCQADVIFSGSVTRAAALLALLLVCRVSPPPAAAQGLPPYSPINPVAASRS